MARPPLTKDQVDARIDDYCRRYGVVRGPEGFPPFPSGRRETRQHREWLAAYRALQRVRQRAVVGRAGSTTSSASVPCALCSRPLEPEVGVPFSRRARTVTLHPGCAELARLAVSAGPDAVAALLSFLWPGRRR